MMVRQVQNDLLATALDLQGLRLPRDCARAAVLVIRLSDQLTLLADALTAGLEVVDDQVVEPSRLT